MNTIIDVVGSHSTGKTTIINTFIELIKLQSKKSFNHVESASRTELQRMDLKLYDKTDDASQCVISLLNWTKILASAVNHDITICTDLGVRSLGYTLAAGVSTQVEQAHKLMVDFFASISFSHMFRVITIYLPIEFQTVPDGVRDEDESYRLLVDKNIHYALETCKIPHFTFTGNEDERYDQALGIIELILKGF